jgi:hypothetical protein
MIIDALLAIVGGLIGWLVSLLPEWQVDLPPGGDQLLGLLRSVNWFLPVSEIMVCLSLFLSLLVGMTVWKWSLKIVDWIADVLP